MNFKKPKFWDLKKPSLLSYILLPLTLIFSINNFFLKFRSKKINKNLKNYMCRQYIFRWDRQNSLNNKII